MTPLLTHRFKHLFIDLLIQKKIEEKMRKLFINEDQKLSSNSNSYLYRRTFVPLISGPMNLKSSKP